MRLYIFVLLLVTTFYWTMLKTKWLTELGLEFYLLEFRNGAVGIFEVCGIILMMYLIGVPIIYIFPQIIQKSWMLIIFIIILIVVSISINKNLKNKVS